MKEIKNVEEQKYIICDIDEEYIFQPNVVRYKFIPYDSFMVKIEHLSFYENLFNNKEMAESYIEIIKEEYLLLGLKKDIVERGLKAKPINIHLKVEL